MQLLVQYNQSSIGMNVLFNKINLHIPHNHVIDKMKLESTINNTVCNKI